MTVYYYDLFTGTAGTLLTSHTADSGATWPNNSSHIRGNNNTELDGNGMLFQSGTGPCINIPSATQPPTFNFEVLFTFERLTSVSDSVAGVLLATNGSMSSCTDHWEFIYREGSGWSFCHQEAPASSYVAGPAVGVTWWMKVTAATSGSNTIFTAYYATSSGGDWTSLLSYTVANLTDQVAVGPFFDLASATSTTGQHIGRLVVQDPSSTTATLSGPTSGNLGSQSTAFTVTLDNDAGYGAITVTPASTGGSDTLQATNTLQVTNETITGTLTVSAGPSNGLVAIEPEGTGGINTLTPTAWRGANAPTRIRVNHPGSDVVQANAPFMVTPYEYGMCFEFEQGVVEWWVGEFSVHRSENTTSGQPTYACFWVGDDADLGGFFAKGRYYGPGNMLTEIASQCFDGTTHGPLRIRSVLASDGIWFLSGPESAAKRLITICEVSSGNPGLLFHNESTTVGDTNLYRIAAGELRTDGIFQAGGNIFAGLAYASTQQVQVGLVNGSYAGIMLGQETYLYRLSANVLATTGSINIGGSIGVNGATPPAQAAHPGTATSTDAGVINAIVTILKNLGFCS